MDPKPIRRRPTEAEFAEAADTLDRTADVQQLVARIKRSSKYWGQTKPNEWFDVRVVADSGYPLRGNGNNYRLSDVSIGIRLANGQIINLTSR